MWKQTPVDGASRVPGCVATVYVRASRIADNERVHIVGNADAIVSRGLLAMLAEFLGNQTLPQVLALDPTKIAQLLNVQSVLARGRNDGLANMMRVIQAQLKGEEQEDLHASVAKSGSKPSVALLLSGGVDSSVALRLLQQDGYDVTAFYLKIWLEDELAHLGECPWEDDVEICQKVCDQAGVPLRIMSLQEEYHRRVMEHTIHEAAAGRTPNPDILCNSRVKFGCFLDSIDEKEFNFVASGHYAQVVRSHDDDSPVKLLRAPDPVKDQSYFLCALGQNQLRRLLFPIGHLKKTQVRELADHFELPNRNRPDSQGLCFLGKIKFADFLNIHLGSKEGDIVDAFSGEIIGRHQGVWYHTVGQRKGMGKSLYPLATSRGPWYVVAKDPTHNIVYASNQYDESIFDQARSEFHVENIHWIAGDEPSSDDGKFRLSFKIRHGPTLVQGVLRITEDAGGIITLDQKDGGLAPGQYAVFYNEDAECIGGGIISERHWAKFLLDTQIRSETAATLGTDHH
jgi:tRNA-specific 2-thiouridylase